MPDPVYEPNSKHKEPWQPGKKGSLCALHETARAQDLLIQSIPHKDKRYAVLDGKPFLGQNHRENKWHGYPVTWKEVPSELRPRLRDRFGVKNRDVQRHWE